MYIHIYKACFRRCMYIQLAIELERTIAARVTRSQWMQKWALDHAIDRAKRRIRSFTPPPPFHLVFVQSPAPFFSHRSTTPPLPPPDLSPCKLVCPWAVHSTVVPPSIWGWFSRPLPLGFVSAGPRPIYTIAGPIGGSIGRGGVSMSGLVWTSLGVRHSVLGWGGVCATGLAA